MAIIPQKRLFDWREIEVLGDLERLHLVLEYMPDEKLMKILEQKRSNGRNDYTVRGVWNSILAAIVYQHRNIESLRRELSRNHQLREMCGLFNGTPTASVYTRFLQNLFKYEDLIDEIFDTLVEQISELLPDFGKELAVDGKAIESYANGKKKTEKGSAQDGRADTDANWGVKKYQGKRKDGSPWEKIKSWFGYKLHLIVDAKYELPVAFEVTKASTAEQPQAHKLVDRCSQKHSGIVDRCEYFSGDKGYDDGKLSSKLWNKYNIKPVIDIRNLWKDEKTRVLMDYNNVVYNYNAMVYCYCPKTNTKREMTYGGFEKDRETLKYRCPGKQYGFDCKGCKECPVSSGIRIPIDKDARRFTPLARSSYKWKQKYKKRTAAERVNSRLDVSFGFEEHFVRGLKKMKLKCSLSLCIMLAMAVGRVKQKREDLMRSLVKTA